MGHSIVSDNLTTTSYEVRVRYLMLGPRFTIGGGDIFASAGFKYGIPLSVKGVEWSYGSWPVEPHTLTSDELTVSPAVAIDIRLMYTFLRMGKHNLSGGLLWDAAFTQLATLTTAARQNNYNAGHTTSLQLGINWSFGL